MQEGEKKAMERNNGLKPLRFGVVMVSSGTRQPHSSFLLHLHFLLQLKTMMNHALCSCCTRDAEGLPCHHTAARASQPGRYSHLSSIPMQVRDNLPRVQNRLPWELKKHRILLPMPLHFYNVGLLPFLLPSTLNSALPPFMPPHMQPSDGGA